MQQRVLVTRSIPFVLERFKKIASCNVDYYHCADKVMPRKELLQKVVGVDGILCLLTDKIDKEVLDAAGSNLKVVSTMSVGYNHIDIDECKKRNIKVGYTPGVLDISTAETAMSLTFATKRKLMECINSAKDGQWGVWSPYQYCGTDISNSIVGIVGLGRIGLTYARMMYYGFNCKILYTSRNKVSSDITNEINATYCPSLHDLLKQSDIVSVHCALTDQTTKLISNKEFDIMKSSSILINTSRGEVIDQDALYDALSKQKITAAGLDVTYPEPLPPSHPLYTLSNCTILPHIGSATISTRNAMATIAMDNLLAGIKKEDDGHSSLLPHQV